MIGTGTIANVAAIVLGGAIGLGVRGGLKAHYQEGLMKAMGLGTLFIGAAGALAGALTVQDGKVASLGTAATLSMILALALGTLVVCVGAMAIVGSIQDGLTGNATTLYTKAVIDGIVVMVMASVYGKGVLFSALPVGVLQGAITLCAGLLAPVFSQPVIDNLSFLGSLLIFCVGVNLAFGTKFKVANMLPALVFGVVFTLVVPYLPL